MTSNPVQAPLRPYHFVDNDNPANQQAQAGGYGGPDSQGTEKEK